MDTIVSMVEHSACITIYTKIKGCCSLSCMFSYKALYFHYRFFRVKLNTSFKLYVPKLSCICWHTDVYRCVEEAVFRSQVTEIGNS